MATARKTLGADRHPGGDVRRREVRARRAGGGTISGTLTLAGQSAPVRLQVTETGDDRYHATGTVVQSDFGIKPYRGFLGALKVRDAVQVEADVDLSQPDGA